MISVRKLVEGIVDVAGRRPYHVLFGALLTLLFTWWMASKLELHSDFLELLPRDSAGFQAFEHQLGRTGGGATLLVIAESPDRKANERFVDDVAVKLNDLGAEHKRCLAACAGEASCVRACGPELLSFVESGTKDVRRFYDENKWLYADLKDLQDVDQTLDHQIAIQSGLVADLLDDDAPSPAPAPAATGVHATAPAASQAPPAKANDDRKPALGLDQFRDRWKAKANKHDDFPTGYFETQDGTAAGVRIVAPGTGMGDTGGDILLARVRQLVTDMNLASYSPQMKVGFAGDIPNAIAEKDSLVSDAAWATGIAFVLILGGVVVFFRSPWSLIVISLPAIIGVGCAYAFAEVTFGYVNTSGAFLGAIILGNGINYPIVLLNRYREFRARGQPPDVARRGAVWNAFRAELVGALVASIAYGSLVVTDFRGFSQFGIIGMLFVWLSMIPCVPALWVIIERLQARLPEYLRDPPPRIAKDGSRGPIMKVVGNVTERWPRTFLVVASVLAVVAAWKLPAYMHDPWEYDFDKLGSRGSKQGGAGEWSNKAEKVFGGKMNIAGAMMLADRPEQVPILKAQILANDAKDPEGKLIADIATAWDLLPGSIEEQKAKLDVLDRVRDRITPAVLANLNDDERPRVEGCRRPGSRPVRTPETLPTPLRAGLAG